MKPRLLMVARTGYQAPLSTTLQRRFESLSRVLEIRVLGTGDSTGLDDRFALVPERGPGPLQGLAFLLLLPRRIARELRTFQPDVVLVQGAHETALALVARRLARSKAKIVCDVHGDWRIVTRLYGSSLRRLVSHPADALARYGIRHADGARAISAYTAGLVAAERGRPPDGVFPAYMDLQPFVDRPLAPLPEQPVVLFLAVLETTKGVDLLADAWRRVAPALPDATLHVVGSGSRAGIVTRLLKEHPQQTRWTESLATDDVVSALDEASFLVLPSRSEGLGRVIIESIARGRPVVATRVGGIVDVVVDNVNGVLVEPGSASALADGIERLLRDPEELDRLAAGAEATAAPWIATPDQFAERVLALVEAVAD